MKRKIEKGTLNIQIGHSSEDNFLEDKVVINKDKWINDDERVFNSIAKIS